MFLSTALLISTVKCDDKETLQKKYDDVKGANVASHSLTGSLLTVSTKFTQDKPLTVDGFYAGETAASDKIETIAISNTDVLSTVADLTAFCMKNEDFAKAVNEFDNAGGDKRAEKLEALKKAAKSDKIPSKVGDCVSKFDKDVKKFDEGMKKGEFELVLTEDALKSVLSEKKKSKTFFVSGKDGKDAKAFKSQLIILSLDDDGKYSVSGSGMSTGVLVAIILIVIVLIALLAGAGYYVYLNQQKSKQEEEGLNEAEQP